MAEKQEKFWSKSSVILLFASSVLLLVPACGTMKAYSGPDRPAEETAIVKEFYSEFPSQQVFITRIDGQRCPSFNNKVAVLPGEHELEISYRAQRFGVRYTSKWNLVLRFHAEAGKVYKVYARDSGRTWKAWLVDTQTGNTVAKSSAY